MGLALQKCHSFTKIASLDFKHCQLSTILKTYMLFNDGGHFADRKQP